MIPVLLALLVQTQQPGRPPVAQAPNPDPSGMQALRMQPASNEPRTPYDSTVAAIRRVGLSVAEVKSSLEVFRRAANRDPSAVVVERGTALYGRCQALARSAAAEARVICRDCVEGERRAALDRYRVYLPSLERLGNQCVTTIARQRRGANADQVAAGLKREASGISDRIVAGLVPYEQRLLAVRRTFGWAAPDSPTRRAS